jgi:hypothetical protein
VPTDRLEFSQLTNATSIPCLGSWTRRSIERRIAQEPRAGRRRRKPAMRGRHDPVGVAAEFLRTELAKGPVLVSELEAAARAAGLLGCWAAVSASHMRSRSKGRRSLSAYDRFATDLDRRVNGSGYWSSNTTLRPSPSRRLRLHHASPPAGSTVLHVSASVAHHLTSPRIVGVSSSLTAPSSWPPLGSGQSAPLR